QATRLVEDHPVQMLIHGNFLSYNRIPGRLDRPVQIETAGNIGGAELRGLVERRRDKAFVRKTPVTAPYAERPPGEVRADQILGAGTADLPVIDRHKRFLAGLPQGQRQFLTYQPAAFGGEDVFTIETTHRVAPADGKTVLGNQAGAVPLRAPARLVAQAPVSQRKRQAQLG